MDTYCDDLKYMLESLLDRVAESITEAYGTPCNRSIILSKNAWLYQEGLIDFDLFKSINHFNKATFLCLDMSRAADSDLITRLVDMAKAINDELRKSSKSS